MAQTLSITFEQESVVAVSAPGEVRWGFHQFPKLSRLDDDRLAVRYSVHADSAFSHGMAKPACVSADGGRSWAPVADQHLENSAEEAIVFPDGEAIRFRPLPSLHASELTLPPARTHVCDRYKREADYYRLDDLPAELRPLRLQRRLPGQSDWREEGAILDVPQVSVPVWRREWDERGWHDDADILLRPTLWTEFGWFIIGENSVLLFTYFYGGGMFEPDGTLPARGPVVVLRSDDRGRCWRLWGIPGWFKNELQARTAVQHSLANADGNYNRLWQSPLGLPQPHIDKYGGLFEPAALALGEGRMICVIRSDSGATHEPLFVSRSQDWGLTWTTPDLLGPFGVMPRLVALENGVIALVYGRPGIQMLFCTDGKGERWHTPTTLLPEAGEKTLNCIASRAMKTTDQQVGHDDTCGNCTVLKTGRDRFLVAGSDFRHVNAAGERCKAIKVWEVVVGVTPGGS